MVRFLLIFFIIYVLSATVALTAEKKIEKTIPFVFSLIIIVQYLIGVISHNLLFGIYVIYVLTLVSLIYVIYKVFRGGKQLFVSYCVTPGIVIFFIAFLYLLWLNKDRMFTVWDEFSHWGLVVKNMDYYNMFANTDVANTIFKDYPPATALFQYFAVKVYGRFNEGLIISALGWLTVSYMTPSISNDCSWKLKSVIKNIICMIFVCIIPMFFLNTCYTEIYVDTILGVLFAYILYSYFGNREKSLFDYVNILISIFVLCIIKDVGLALALFIGVIILISNLTNRNFRANRKKLCYSILVIITSLIAKLSWSIYLELSATAVSSWNYSNISMKSVLNLLSGQGKQYQYTTCQYFFDRLRAPVFMNLSYVAWIMIAFVFMAIIMKLISDKKYKKQIFISLVLTIICVFIYTVGMLTLYVFVYTEGEATSLASFSRYIGTILLGLILYEMFWLVSLLLHRKNELDYSTIALVIAIALVGINPLLNMTLYKKDSVNKTIYARYPYSFISAYNSVLTADDNVWFISQLSDGYDSFVARYNIMPAHMGVNERPMSALGKPYEDGEFRADYTAEEWAEMLRNSYTYVYIYGLDEQFINIYGGLFEDELDITEGSLYKIYNENGSVMLRKVEA